MGERERRDDWIQLNTLGEHEPVEGRLLLSCIPRMLEDELTQSGRLRSCVKGFGLSIPY